MPGKPLARLFVLLSTLTGAFACLASPVTVIANASDVESLTRSELVGVVRGERRKWSDGTPIKVVLPKRSSATYKQLNRIFFNSGSNDIHRHWLGMVFSGRAAPPQYVDSEQDAVEFVKRTPGAITVLLVNTASDNDRLSIKVFP